MPSRLAQFSRFPWTGGLNTSVDASLLDPNDIVQGDNVIFTTQGTRKQREGVNYDWDSLNITSVSRASSGTTRTLVTSGYVWKIGERFRVSSLGNAAYNLTNGVVTSTDSTIKSTVTFSVASPGKVNWTAHGLLENAPVAFRTTGSLPAVLTADKVYFVRNPSSNDFEVAEEPNSTSLNFASAGTGTHTARKYLEDVITYTGTSSLSEVTTADTAAVITLSEEVICQHDFWYDDGAEKSHELMVFTSAGRLFRLNLVTGGRTPVYDVGTAYTSLPLSRASMVTFDNRLIIACDGQNNVMKYVFPTAVGGTGVLADVVNETGYASTPKPEVVQVHLGRIWCDDKANFDRIHYCETGTYNVWQGAGDSGALDISPGDGDPSGVTAIFPPFKGDLVVAKRTKLYRIQGLTPEEFQLSKITDGLGCVGQQSVAAVDQEDIFFISDRGMHSLNATNAYGAFSGAYISAAIQGSINNLWQRSAQSRIKAAYVETINSVAVTVAESSETVPNNLWFYNVPLKRWYRWPDLDCASVIMVQDDDQQRLYIGTSTGRIARTFSGINQDIDEAGNEQPITMTIKTGRIFPDGSPSTMKAFKQFGLIYKPTGTYNIQVSVKIDNFSPQVLTFSDPAAGDVLDLDFILGESLLGGDRVAQAYIQTLDGYGRGVTITLTQTGVNEFGEILGFQLYYENAEWPQETRSGDET